ncbi:S-adenosyl-L-methionine-dependent methyltransferase [Xylona heveae TC161]|uniref:S-adenosyl-L-methionine-dependent methyltransferase n=1 Tax=Xylona heveae (strain CBS 132557 / TC161) TaxID=1328760 RepID=A0A164ZHB8_XYLHT|nr:S-adenosyl-L-methionine-dependent methyltransferase [Xylona heveae TC161]KZF19104.1 S-adenosyl-L-methionine-dependent methyltransferase [Xylona heveae TC161]
MSSVQTTKDMYNARSGKYEDSFHPRHARDFVQWSDIQPGHSVLDLACGTGLVSFPAVQQVGSDGSVVGVDISEGMLWVARQKPADGLNVRFLTGDIRNLDKVAGLQPENAKGFDRITCSSALVLLDNPAQAIKHWTSYLKPGGKLIIDVPSEDSLIYGSIMEKVGIKLRRPVAYYRSWVSSIESLPKLMREAGLVIDNLFRTESYDGDDFKVKEAGEWFDSVIDKPAFRCFELTDTIDKAKKEFLNEVKKLSKGGDTIYSRLFLYVAVGRKKLS